MFLPSKHISETQSLLVVGAQILQVLDHPKHVSACIDATRSWRKNHGESVELPFWWYLLALDALFTLGLIDARDGEIVKARNA